MKRWSVVVAVVVVLYAMYVLWFQLPLPNWHNSDNADVSSGGVVDSPALNLYLHHPGLTCFR